MLIIWKNLTPWRTTSSKIGLRYSAHFGWTCEQSGHRVRRTQSCRKTKIQNHNQIDTWTPEWGLHCSYSNSMHVHFTTESKSKFQSPIDAEVRMGLCELVYSQIQLLKWNDDARSKNTFPFKFQTLSTSFWRGNVTRHITDTLRKRSYMQLYLIKYRVANKSLFVKATANAVPLARILA